MNPVVRKLIAKELFLNRWFLAGSAAAAALSALMASFGQAAFNIASITWITTVIALGVMLAIYGVMHERKERTLEFVLSLPLSVRDYVRAKLLGLLLCFLLPWLVATLSVVVLVLADPDVPDGLLPYLLVLCVYLLTNFGIVLCGAMHVRGEAATAALIVITNMSVSLFMFGVGAVPGLKEHMFGPTPIWNSTFYNVLLVELIVLAVAIALPLATTARRRDFI